MEHEPESLPVHRGSLVKESSTSPLPRTRHLYKRSTLMVPMEIELEREEDEDELLEHCGGLMEQTRSKMPC